MDTDPKRLELAHKLVEMVINRLGKNWKVRSSTERRDVLAGADFVINQIEVHGLDTVKLEFEIPLKYGVKQCIGDTLGQVGSLRPCGLSRHGLTSSETLKT